MTVEGQRSRDRRRARTCGTLLVAPAGHAHGKPHLDVKRCARVAREKMEFPRSGLATVSYVAN